MIGRLNKKRSASILGLSLDGTRLEGVVLRRTNGSAQVVQRFTVPLTVDPLKNEAELVGRGIRGHLEQAGVRERKCVVCLPQEWALFLPAQLPDLPEEDLRNFLQIEAERGFPFGLEALLIATSRLELPGGEKHAGQAAVPREHVTRLEQALRAARLRPVSFSLGICALQRPETDGPVLALVVGDQSVGLQVSAGGGIAALRVLDSAFETEAGTKRFFADVIAREIRVTIGQLPALIRGQLRRVRIFGPGAQAQALARDLRPRAQALGLEIEQVTHYPAGELPLKVPPEAEVSPALSLAVQHLAGEAPALEFLPPKISAFRQFADRHSGKKLAWAGAAAAAAAVITIAAFLIQQWQLSRLESEWAAMRSTVENLDGLQQQIKRFRPWFDPSFRTLAILRRVTEAFPETGTVTAKTLEIRDGSIVICSGEARDQQAFLKMLDQLRATPEFGDVTVDQVRGQNPMQFSFSFKWGGGGGDD